MSVSHHSHDLPHSGDIAAAPRLLLNALTRNWWLILLRGLCALAFGLFAITNPGAGLLALVFLFGGYAFADGVLSLIAAVTRDAPKSRVWLAVSGIISLLASAAVFLWPGFTAVMLALLIGAWAIATGVAQIVGAIRLRKEIDREWLLLLSGVISVLFGAVLMLSPGAGSVALVLMIAFYAILFGILLCMLALRLRGLRRKA